MSVMDGLFHVKLFQCFSIRHDVSLSTSSEGGIGEANAVRIAESRPCHNRYTTYFDQVHAQGICISDLMMAE